MILTRALYALPWMRLVLVAQALMSTKRHYDKLTPAERADLKRILAESKGRPKNVSQKDRERLRVLVANMEPGSLARDLVGLRRRR